MGVSRPNAATLSHDFGEAETRGPVLAWADSPMGGSFAIIFDSFDALGAVSTASRQIDQSTTGGYFMPIHRSEKISNYTVVSNYALRDKSISLKAKGLLMLLLSLPDGWKFSQSGLATLCKESERAIRSATKELEQTGYLVRRRERNENKYGHSVYEVYEIPRQQNPDDMTPKYDSPRLENPMQDYPKLENESERFAPMDTVEL